MKSKRRPRKKFCKLAPRAYLRKERMKLSFAVVTNPLYAYLKTSVSGQLSPWVQFRWIDAVDAVIFKAADLRPLPDRTDEVVAELCKLRAAWLSPDQMSDVNTELALTFIHTRLAELIAREAFNPVFGLLCRSIAQLHLLYEAPQPFRVVKRP